MTERGGRTSHAAIVSRELGIPAVVGAERRDGDARGRQTQVTVSCAEGETGHVLRGERAVHGQEIDPAKTRAARGRRSCSTSATPSRRFKLVAACPATASASRGWSSSSRAGSACTRWRSRATRRSRRSTQREVDRDHRRLRGQDGVLRRPALAQGIGTIAAAFCPRPVILRFSDFKTNEYARLVGGAASSRARRTRCSAGAARAATTTRLQGGLPARGRGGQARARRVRPHEPEADDPVLPDAARRASACSRRCARAGSCAASTGSRST